MCTLIVFYRLSDRYPLVLAANRDERPGRPADRPDYWADQTVFAPRDRLAGGTWIGLNRFGLTAAITNLADVPYDPDLPSRGRLVAAALEHRTPTGAIATALRLTGGRSNGYQLLVADRHEARLLWTDGRTCFLDRLKPGLHVLTGWGHQPDHCVRDHLIRTLPGINRQPPPLDDHGWLDGLLSFHGAGSEDGTCAHGPDLEMETVSSMTVHLPADGNRWIVRWREGRPCQGGAWNDRAVDIWDDDKQAAWGQALALIRRRQNDGQPPQSGDDR